MERPEYHHYVPRFILHNYRINKLPNKNNRNRRKNKNKATQGSQDVSDDKDLKDGLVRQLNLKTKQLVEVRLSKTFGMHNMYSNPSAEANVPNDIEQRLSKLESRAGDIIANILRDFESGKPSTTLKRADKDTLRKFLFIMHYRNRTFHTRFTPTKDAYAAHDRARMLAFMTQHRITHPLQVWHRNIRAILAADLAAYPCYLTDGARLAARYAAYEPDMTWFLKNTQAHYLYFVTPQAPRGQGQEFLLTDNAFSVFEGPVSARARGRIGI